MTCIIAVEAKLSQYIVDFGVYIDHLIGDANYPQG